MGRPGCWHRRIPLQQSVKIIGIVETYLGAFSTYAMFIYILEKDRLHPKTNKRELHIAMVISGMIQFVMGILLLIGAMVKSRGVCIFWIVSTLSGLVFIWNYFTRPYEIWVVYLFYRELKREQEMMDIAEKSAQLEEASEQPSSSSSSLVLLQHHQQKMLDEQVVLSDVSSMGGSMLSERSGLIPVSRF